jgi:hypothetical protein
MLYELQILNSTGRYDSIGSMLSYDAGLSLTFREVLGKSLGLPPPPEFAGGSCGGP